MARVRRLAGNQDAAVRVLGQALDAAREVYGIADRRVVELLLRPDEPDHGGARVDADADVEVPARLPQLALEGDQHLLHLERRGNRVLRVAGIVERRAPEGHDAIADELVEGPAVAEHHPDLAREIAIEQGDDLLRRARLRERREAAYVREQDRHLAGLARKRLDRLALVDDLLH